MDDGASTPSCDEEMADEVFLSVFPNGVPSARPVAGCAILASFPLGPEHLAKLALHHESGQALGVEPSLRKRMSRVHHRAAQFLAGGMQPGRVALLCGLDVATISILQSDPLFGELIEYYSLMVEDEFKTVVEEMADLNLDIVGELRFRLDSAPGNFTVTQLLEAMKALSDRTGNGPTSNHNVRSVSFALNGADFQRVKAGVHDSHGGPSPGRSPQSLPDGAVQSLQGLLDLPPVLNARTVSATEVGRSEGVRLGTEGEGPPTDGLPEPTLPVPRVD